MPKFKFNPRTGMMEPEKNSQIYFGGAMNGGLRVDDHKNNVKYIICKDGSIRNISNLKNDDVNIYDRRDAIIISDRVKRFLGGDHKYSDYHMFWKGHMLNEGKLMTFSEFIKTYEP